MGTKSVPSSILLLLVCDANVASWASVRPSLAFSNVLRSFEFCLHAHIRLNAANTFALVACDHNRSQLLLPSAGTEVQIKEMEEFQEMRGNMLQSLQSFVETAGTPHCPGTSLASALSLALCYINRIIAAAPDMMAQIMVLSASPDTASQYISVMNAIFSAAKMGVVIDSCHVISEQSSFLQQAADITGGVYLRPQDATSLLQSLLSTAMCPKSLRSQLPFPSMSLVECKAACFCHKKEVDMGHICSVCFSIFCARRDVCPTCGIPFKKLKVEED